ncbi:MAG: molybdenum cofactor biosynthesis protein MoaE [Bacteroidetes bacterium]|nr:molybdenum cofactor biosynthesis protein MoaE [Bacteroidota bacterium]MBK6836922.1 molybdenum cofactor biosynthesis protein MoaE [Bacteroidota bacterium]MBP6649260.1 molybdenum cofactor biosynthesis protein MoaE [Bacteroidia bacterium]
MDAPVKKKKTMFIEGPVTPDFIATSISKHSSKTDIGAHQIFLGQIRSDSIDGKIVKAIEFSSYGEMADEQYLVLREELFSKFKLSCMHVYHSLGRVHSGEINLFVFVSSKHRKDATDACSELVEMIKTKLPIWGKEIFEDEKYVWKVNS